METKDTITLDDVLGILARMADDMDSNRDYLIELDSAIGDGDHGVTMTRGFRAVKNALPEWKGEDIGTVLAKAGTTFNGAAGSTIGAFMAIAFVGAGKEALGKREIGLGDLVKMAHAAEARIRERGKAKPGDKTMLDAIVPATRALDESMENRASLLQALENARQAAEQGMISTRDMKAAMGRARWIADRTIGHQDPGATSSYLMLKSAVDYLSEEHSVPAPLSEVEHPDLLTEQSKCEEARDSAGDVGDSAHGFATTQ